MKKLPTFYPFEIGTDTDGRISSSVRQKVLGFFNRQSALMRAGFKRVTGHDVELWWEELP